MRKLKAFYRRNYNLLNFIVDLLILTFIVLLIILILSLAKDLKTLKSNREKWGRSESIGLRCGGLAKEIEKSIIEAKQENLILSGEASYYSENGCLGCSPNLTMANGERLDDGKFTIALTPDMFNKYKNQFVRVKNIKGTLSVKAKVTDTGGFGALGRVADLSLATKSVLGCSDLCQVEIYR